MVGNPNPVLFPLTMQFSYRFGIALIWYRSILCLQAVNQLRDQDHTEAESSKIQPTKKLTKNKSFDEQECVFLVKDNT